ncbi:MAG: hypothetical protein OXC62_06840 [Aestuariivita sp.]|nr:hypothetical protein [Aestuariivita sp.]
MIGDATPERFVNLEGSMYQIEKGQPWYLFDQQTWRLITNGTCIDRPYIFPLRNHKAAAIVAYNGTAFEIRIVEE